MPTELDELVEFLHHGNTQIRQIAAENLVPYSKTQPQIFRTGQLTPVKDLKVLIKDYAAIAKNALTILINISTEAEVLRLLAEDDVFLESILLRITNPKETNANDFSMLLANMAKSDAFSRLQTLKRSSVPKLSTSQLVLDQLVDIFNRGADGLYNPSADFDYLAYVFADLAKHPKITMHLLAPAAHEPFLPPLTALLPFTTHASPIRRLGISSLVKNIALIHTSPKVLLQPPLSILLQTLLPLCGPDPNFTDEETDGLIPELQYLGPEQKREPDLNTIRNHVDTLFLLVTKGGDSGKNIIKDAGTYVIIRELHLEVEDEAVQEVCERVVQVLMGDEIERERAPDGQTASGGQLASSGSMVTQKEDENEDDKIVEVF